MTSKAPNTIRPLAAVAAIFLGGNATSDSFRIQVIATVVALSDRDLKELARTIIDCVSNEGAE